MLQVVMQNGVVVSHPVAELNSQTSVAGREIMLVEDNEVVARALKKYLEARGYGAPIFLTGKSAMEHVETSRPAAVIADIHLPDLSGLILIQRLRERLGDATPIVVLSGDASMATINSLPHVGATYYFSKPVRPDALLKRLEELMAV